MATFIQNKQTTISIIPDGEYTAVVDSLRYLAEKETILFRFKLTTAGFENSVVAGFCGAHWKPSTRTSANLRQWCINLGINVVSGKEEDIDLDTLVGRECRVIIQGYTSKAGEQRCKVTNALPKEKRLQAATAPIKQGLHIGNKAPVTAQQVQAPVTTVEPMKLDEPVANTTKSSEDDLW